LNNSAEIIVPCFKNTAMRLISCHRDETFPRKATPMKTAQLLDVIRMRRSVRVYKTGRVSAEQLEDILQAARWAP
jgi:hypothetical protein